jgi:hypothetical protein
LIKYQQSGGSTCMCGWATRLGLLRWLLLCEQ